VKRWCWTPRNDARHATWLAAVLLLVLPAACIAQPDAPGPRCTVAGPLVRVEALPEGSGLAASARMPGRLWSHNDSGQPVLVALDTAGKVTGHLRVTGATVTDWEAVAVGPCPAGSCIHVADVGDNDGRRDRITVYRLPEPTDASTSAAVAERFEATYPDGPQDAETLLVARDGQLYVVTKGDAGPISLYRFPRERAGDGPTRLERVGQPRAIGKTRKRERITDGSVSPDGDWIVLRTGEALIFHRADDLLAGHWQEAGRVELGTLDEPQGEGVAFGGETSIFLAGEGGGKKKPGTFARLTCTLVP
jgi:hypothetical protein